MPRKGKMWNYFSVMDKNAKKAECKYCKKILSYKTTVSNLKNHLKQKHITVYEEICRDNINNVNENGTRIADSDAPAAVFIAVTGNPGDGYVSGDPIGFGACDDGAMLSFARQGHSTSTQNPLKKQRVSKASNLSRPLSTQESTNLDKLLLRMIAIDCQPFSIVDDEGFKTLVYGLNPNYKLPDRKTLSTSLLSHEYEERLAAIKSVVNAECNNMCITVDCWTSRTMLPYMAITGHFINETTLEFKSMLIQCCLLDETHTGGDISQAINSTIQEWNLEGKINFFVTDNTSNMQVAANLLGYPHYGCYAHALNLVAQSALTHPELESTVSKIKKTVAYFKRNSIAKEELIKYQINSLCVANESALTLIMGVPTCWISTFLMLQRCIQLKEAIRAIVSNLDVDLPVIPLQEWKCLEQFCEVLKPLYEATVIMGTENYLAASKATVIIQGLLNMYEQMSSNCKYFASVKGLAKNINLSLKDKFKDTKRNTHITICTFLDPRFKHFAFDSETLIKTKKFIIDQICYLIGEDQPYPNPESCVSEMTLWNVIDQKISASLQPRSTYSIVTEEIDMYMKQVVISRESCPFEWWRGHKTIYPTLFLIFVKYFNIVVTSMPGERAFSKAGQIISDRRTRLTSSKVAKLMFLHGNKSFHNIY